jgi:indole-3-glycerol phosphate synthase
MRALKEAERAAVGKRLRSLGDRSRPYHPLLPPADGGTGIIAEVKKASPSHGAIAEVSSAVQAARYAQGGAAAVSVLVDRCFFGGSCDDLQETAAAVEVPVLCKEFIFFREQLDLAWMLGADMALLIARMLSDEELSGLFAHAKHLGLEPLVEIHETGELARVLRLGPSLVMANSRDLSTLELRPERAIAALQAVPEGVVTIYASGISSSKDIRAVRGRTGTRLFLVGTSIMQKGDPSSFIRELSDVH